MRSAEGRRRAGGAIVASLLLAGCGADGSTMSPVARDATTSAEPFTVIDETGAAVRVESVERIIPLDGDVAEVVFALGFGDRVVATDISATHPPAADALPEIGYQRALTAEAIAAFDPTLLLATDLAGPPEAIDDLERLGYPLVIIPNEPTRDGPAEKIRAVAAALGTPEAGDALAADVEAEIAAAIDAVPVDGPSVRVAALYLRGSATQLVLGADNAAHWLIEAAGGIDISSELGVVEAEPVNAEAILAADPEVLLVTTSGLESVGGVDGLLELGSFAETTAGRHRRVVVLDTQLLLGNGPRVAAVIDVLATEIAAVAAARTQS